MTVHYRDAAPDDLPVIVDIYNSIVAGRMVTADLEPVTPERRQHWFDAHEPTRRPLWMVNVDGADAAWVSFQSFYGRPAYNATAEISIYIHEKFRRQQLGTRILKDAMTSCARLQIKTLLGYIFAHNEPSLRLFRKMGFTDWGHFPKIANLDGVERDLIIVGKRINP